MMEEVIITSSLLIMIVIFIRTAFKGKLTLKLQYALWLLVVIRLILPFSFFKSPVSIMNYVSLPEKFIIAEDDNIEASAEYPQAIDNQSAINENNHTEDLISDSNEISPVNIFKYIWYLGITIIGLYMIISNVLFSKRLIKNRKRVQGYSCKLPIYTSNAISSPCLFCWFQGTGIYVTSKLIESPEEMKHIISHELSHYHNLDLIWALARNILIAVYWFNPLVWLAAYISRQDCELACDEAAIKRLGEEERFAYGKTLVGLIPIEKPVESLLSIATTMNTDRKSLKERITMIAKKPKMLLSTFLSIILIITAVVGCTFTGENDSNNPEKLAENFLENIYEIYNHDRFENYMKAIDEYTKEYIKEHIKDDENLGIIEIGPEVAEEYTKIYSPLMTEKALDDLFASRYYSYFDALAYDNNFTSKIKDISLKETEGSGEAVVYKYKVDLDIKSLEEEKSMEIGGIVQLGKDEEGEYKVSYFTINNNPLVEMFK